VGLAIGVAIGVVGTSCDGATTVDAFTTGSKVGTVPLVGADIGEAMGVSMGADITGEDVTGVDVTGENVTGGDVIGADVTGSDVTGADAMGADAVGAVTVGDIGLLTISQRPTVKVLLVTILEKSK
jgi:uncharacterized protein YjbI with pentapeptide repeats